MKKLLEENETLTQRRRPPGFYQSISRYRYHWLWRASIS